MSKYFIAFVCLIGLTGLACMTSAMVADLPTSVSPTVTELDVTTPGTVTNVESLELQDVIKMPLRFEVCTDVLHVRSNPFVANGNVVGWLNRGDVVFVHEMAEGWGRLAGLNEDRVRWVKLSYLCP